MAGAGITFDADAALARLGRAVAALADPEPMLDEIGGRLEASTRLRFERGAGPDGVAWKPSERALAQDGQTLVNSGRLRDSIQHVVEGDDLLVGTNVIYAAIHQFGGEAGRNRSVTLPARPYLGLDAGDGRAIERIARRWIERSLA